MSHTLLPDTQAPNLNLKLVGGGEWNLSDQKPSSFTMVIFYRGLHCPVCKNYLTKLNYMIFLHFMLLQFHTRDTP